MHAYFRSIGLTVCAALTALAHQHAVAADDGATIAIGYQRGLEATPMR